MLCAFHNDDGATKRDHDELRQKSARAGAKRNRADDLQPPQVEFAATIDAIQ